MKIKAIIFDKDGTLLDFDSFWVTVSAYAVREILTKVQTVSISEEEILSALGVHDNSADINGVLCYGTYSQMGREIYRVLKKYGCGISEGETVKLTVKAFHSNADKGIVKPTGDNLPDILRKLKGLGIRLAVVTTDDPFVTDKCLETLRINSFFDAVYTDNGNFPPKPDPFCVDDFCDKTGIGRSEIVMVGDTLTDARFAENSGIRFIGISKNENNKKYLERVTDTVISDIAQVFEILE